MNSRELLVSEILAISNEVTPFDKAVKSLIIKYVGYSSYSDFISFVIENDENLDVFYKNILSTKYTYNMKNLSLSKEISCEYLPVDKDTFNEKVNKINNVFYDELNKNLDESVFYYVIYYCDKTKTQEDYREVKGILSWGPNKYCYHSMEIKDDNNIKYNIYLTDYEYNNLGDKVFDIYNKKLDTYGIEINVRGVVLNSNIYKVEKITY